MDVSPSSTGAASQRGRIEPLRALIDAALADGGACRVIDIGGAANFWDRRALDPSPARAAAR